MKTIHKITFSLSLVLLLGCSKEQKFTRAIQSKWDIDKISIYEVSSGCGENKKKLISLQKNAGQLILTDKKIDYAVNYQTADEAYEGRFEYSDGTTEEFVYEYIYILALDGFKVIIHGANYESLTIDILTKNKWDFSTNNYYGGCYYTLVEYELSR